MNIKNITICLILIFLFACKQNDKNLMDVCIFKEGDNYQLTGSIIKKKIGSFKTADQAIQYAINNMSEGGCIEILSGKYELKNTVYLANGIWLKGSGRRTEILVTTTDTTEVGIFGSGLKDVKVSDLSIVAIDTIQTLAGICFDHCGDCEIDNIYAEGFKKYGIWLRNNSFLCHINNCTAANNMRANIFTDSLFWSRAGEYMPNLITNCITYGGWNGIEINKSIVLNIVGCIVHQPENFGFFIHNVSNSVLVNGCRTYQTQNDAVVVEKSHEVNLTSNIFCWSRGKGIVLRGVDWGTISGNNIIDSGSERYGGFSGVGDANGIELTDKCRCILVNGNNIFNWGGQGIMNYAVFEDESCENNLFSSLNINYYEKGGVKSHGKNSVVSNIIQKSSPALHGKPEGPDPLFIPERLQEFIRE